MDTTDFAILVGRLERESDASPKAYAFNVAVVAALGYALLAVVAVAILIACCFVIASLLSGERPRAFAILGGVAGVIMLVSIVRALWVQIDLPAGREIMRDEAPALFAAIDELLQKMATTRKGRTHLLSIDSVAVDREFNASLRQIPRWGVFGNFHNHLQLGIPLLTALSIAEFKTVLAHEIGHLGSAHGRFSAWIYRQRATWEVLQRKFEQPTGIVDRILAVFYGWYAPYFNAYTFVLARNHEYAADRAAARATNARVLGRALIKVELIGRFLSEVFWKRLFDQVENVPEPQYPPYSVMPRAFTMAQKEWQRQDWLSSSLRSYASEGDTHPGLGERLAALDVSPELPSQVPDKSALSLLGENSASFIKWCDDEWHAEYVPAWRKRYDAIREARWKIAQYEITPQSELKPDDLWEKATLLLEVAREQDAVQTLEALVARDGAVAKAQFLLGRLRLDAGDESGLKNLTLAAQHDPELLASVGEVGYGYLMQRGRRGEAQRFWDRIRAA